jgi:hypothetical protein
MLTAILTYVNDRARAASITATDAEKEDGLAALDSLVF